MNRVKQILLFVFTFFLYTLIPNNLTLANPNVSAGELPIVTQGCDPVLRSSSAYQGRKTVDDNGVSISETLVISETTTFLVDVDTSSIVHNVVAGMANFTFDPSLVYVDDVSSGTIDNTNGIISLPIKSHGLGIQYKVIFSPRNTEATSISFDLEESVSVNEDCYYYYFYRLPVSFTKLSEEKPEQDNLVVSTPVEFDCLSVSEIDFFECRTLVTFYNSTDGGNWYPDAKTDWLQTTTPCSWNGVGCSNGTITQIIKSDSNLSGVLPSEIGVLDNLVTLDLSNNRITNVPPELGQLTTLSSLRLDGNRITSIPSEIETLTSLRTLSLNDNLLTNIPDEIGSIGSLRYLYLDDNNLSTIPLTLGGLSNLLTLNLGNNNLTYIPPELGDLTLRFLLLDGNQLSVLPVEIGNIHSLEYLHLHNNQLQDTSFVSGLTELRTLVLSNNQINELSSEAGNLLNLRTLNLSNNELTLFPTIITQLSLRNLHLENNQITSIPPEIGDMTSLERLYLGNNEIKTLSSEIGNLNNLTGLFLNQNQLEYLPTEISNLNSLHELMLYNNKLLEIPASLGSRWSLQWLWFVDNNLTSIPIELTQNSLDSLYLDTTCESDSPEFVTWVEGTDEVFGRSTISCSDVQISGRLWEERDNNDDTYGENDVPISNVIVEMVGSIEQNVVRVLTTTTDSDGYYSVNNIPFATYTISVNTNSLGNISSAPISFDPDNQLDGLSRVELSDSNPHAQQQNFAYRISGDLFELDGVCSNASLIMDGSIHTHTFHDFGDVDWIEFEAEEGELYQIVVEPIGDSTADMHVEVFPDCETARQVEQNHSFAPNILVNVPAHQSGMYKVKLHNAPPSVFGEDIAYRISVTHVPDIRTGAVVIIAGRDEEDDALQLNIHNITNRVYKLFKQNGYSDERIHYVATSSTPNDDPDVIVDATATITNVGNIITNTIFNQVDDHYPLTIYMMSHGLATGGFYLDEVNGQRISPEQLDTWLDQLQLNRPNLPINIIIDACYAGSFIANDVGSTLSGDNRVIITSSANNELAWASPAPLSGARFSDLFLTSLEQSVSLQTAFLQAQFAVSVGTHDVIPQHAWIDDNGDGVHNMAADGAVAAGRYLFDFDALGLSGGGTAWPPYIQSVTVTAEAGIATVHATVLTDPDGLGIGYVQATLFPPSFVPDVPEEEDGRLLTTDGLSKLILEEGENGVYTGTFSLAEAGAYEVRVDAEGVTPANVDMVLVARPAVETFNNNTVIPLASTTQKINITPSAETNLFIVLLILIPLTVSFVNFGQRIRPKTNSLGIR